MMIIYPQGNGWLFNKVFYDEGIKLIVQKKVQGYYLRIEEQYPFGQEGIFVASMIEGPRSTLVEYRMVHLREVIELKTLRNLRAERMLELEMFLEMHHFFQGKSTNLSEELLEGTDLERELTDKKFD